MKSLLVTPLLLALTIAAFAQQPAPAADPVLQAMQAELARSQQQLQLADMQRPYYIEYRLVDEDSYTADAAFGALRFEQRQRGRILRAVVRVGDHKLDSYFGQGEGTAEIAPLENDVLALRHQIWLATDRAYKSAIEALTRKQVALKQFEAEQLPDDFSREDAAQYIAPLAHVEADPMQWKGTLKAVSALYRTDAELQDLSARVLFRAQNRYLVNTEGTVLRQPFTVYAVSVTANTQAPDGMRLDRAANFVVANPRELPSATEVRAATEKLIAILAAMRKAPLVEDEYRGPVLLNADAASSIFSRYVGTAVLGRKPRPGTTSRTIGDYASSYKSRVLPDFISVVDDPTAATYADRTLVGSYRYDDEGVAARPVTLIEKGQLVSYLLGRSPIRDFPKSNGHGRSNAFAAPQPALGNLFLRAADPQPYAQLKRKLLEMCKDRGLEYGYIVETTNAAEHPQILYRAYVKDGHEELVRGAEFFQFDARALRSDLIAAGDDPKVDNRIEAVNVTVVAPSLLFGEIEVRRTSAGRDKLPDYPAPALAGALKTADK